MKYIQQNGILVPQTSRNRQRGFITCGPAFFGGASAPSTTFAQYITALSPVAWWRMDDAVGSTYLNDTIANEHATLQGTYTLGVPGLVTGDSDTAVQFVSGASCAYTSAASKWTMGTGDYSAILLAKWTTGNAYSTVAACRDSTVAGTLFTIAVSRIGGSVEVQAQDGSANICLATTNYNDGNVHVIGIEQVASTRILSLYVDGALKANVTLSASRPTATDMHVTIGANIGAIQNFVGTADEFAMFNFALSSTQMADISNLVHNGHL